MARRKTNEEFIKEVYELVGDEYEFLEEYKGAKTKIQCKHNLCRHVWGITPDNFLRRKGCPRCAGNEKRTDEEFAKEIYALVGNEYVFLEEYINNQTKIKCKHNACEYEYYVKPNHFFGGARCPECAGNVKKTNEQFIQEIHDLVGDEYTFLEEYTNRQTKIECEHSICGYKWSVTPSNFLSGTRCPQCYGCVLKTNEEFMYEFNKLVGNEYELLDTYVNAKTKIKCRHSVCEYEWDVLPSNILGGSGCPKCAGNVKKTNEQFIQEIHDLVGDEYTFLEEYRGASAKILCQHNRCGYKYEVTPSSFLTGNRCARCQGLSPKSTKEFALEVLKLGYGKYVLLSKYKAARSKVKILHKDCGNIYEVTPNGFLNGTRCPQCNLSKGEEKIRIYLNKYNIKSIPQHTFDNCQNINPLPFDFHLPDYNLLIEYDGIQHFEPIDFFGGQEQFEYQQQNDNIKNQYCKDNNIPLLRIPYWDFNNIEQILEEWLKKHGVLQKDENIA